MSFIQHLHATEPHNGQPIDTLCGKRITPRIAAWRKRLAVCPSCVEQGQHFYLVLHQELQQAEQFAAAAGHTTYRLLDLIQDTDDYTLKERALAISNEGMKMAGEGHGPEVHHVNIDAFDELPDEVKDVLMRLVTGYGSDGDQR